MAKLSILGISCALLVVAGCGSDGRLTSRWGDGAGSALDGATHGPDSGVSDDSMTGMSADGSAREGGDDPGDIVGHDGGGAVASDSGGADVTVTPAEELGSALHDYLGAPEDRDLIAKLIDEHWSFGEPTRVIYVAPPEGTADGTGTREDPRRDLKGALEAAEPGDHFYLAPGVYSMNTVRDAFGYVGSLVFLRAKGTRERKIVVRTDPQSYDPGAGQVAQIDFEFSNSWPNHRAFSFSLSGRHWVLQGLEIRNIDRNGIWLGNHSKYNMIRDCEIHHANHDGTNNFGLIVMATAGPSYNLVIGNHLHHSGGLDEDGNVVDYGGSNGGCTYSETRQSYDSDYSNLSDSSTRAQVDAALDPADSDAYYFNNLVHDCHNGIATKNNAEGPFYILSNVIHSVLNGMKITLAHSVIRNNIIYRGNKLGVGILLGWSAGSKALSMLYHGVNMTVANNTIVGASHGLSYYVGWNLELLDNLIVDVNHAHNLRRNSYDWYPDSWPGVVGEWVHADLTPSHPYYEYMPKYLQEMAGKYRRVKASGNVYSTAPVLSVNVESDFYKLAGTTFSKDHVVLDVATIMQHLRDAAQDDYRRDASNPGPLANAGSAMR